nr:hypothetical protein [Rubrobacter marinus]
MPRLRVAQPVGPPVDLPESADRPAEVLADRPQDLGGRLLQRRGLLQRTGHGELSLQAPLRLLALAYVAGHHDQAGRVFAQQLGPHLKVDPPAALVEQDGLQVALVPLADQAPLEPLLGVPPALLRDQLEERGELPELPGGVAADAAEGVVRVDDPAALQDHEPLAHGALGLEQGLVQVHLAPELVLGTPALGIVAERDDRAPYLPVPLDGRGRVGDRERRPVPPHKRIPVAATDLARTEHLQQRALLGGQGAPVGAPVVDGLVHVPAEKLRLRPAEHALRRGVEGGDAPVPVHRVHPLAEGAHGRGQKLQPVAQLLLGPLALAHVAGHAVEDALLGDRRRVPLDPGHPTVLAEVAALEPDDGLSAGEHPGGLPDAREVRRVHEVGVEPPDELLRLVTDDRAAGPVHRAEDPVQPHGRYDVRRGVQHPPELPAAPRLLLPQRPLAPEGPERLEPPGHRPAERLQGLEPVLGKALGLVVHEAEGADGGPR